MQLCMQCQKTQTDSFHNPEDSMRSVDPIRSDSVRPNRSKFWLSKTEWDFREPESRWRLTEFCEFENIRPKLHAK